MTKQVEMIVKGLPAHETLVDGRMCMLNDTPPYIFANQRFPYDPCTYPQISSACCNHTRCDASLFTYCHTYHTHSYHSSTFHTTCYYYGMACYTDDEYAKNHKNDYFLLYIIIIVFFAIVPFSFMVLYAYNECSNRGISYINIIFGNYDDDDSDDGNDFEFSHHLNYDSEATMTTAIPSAPLMYTAEIQNEQSDRWDGNTNTSTSSGSSSSGYGTIAVAERVYPAYPAHSSSTPL